MVADGQAEDSKSSQQLLKSYETTYQKFVDDFRASSDTDERLTLINRASEDINAIFSEHVDGPLIADVLPSLVNARLVDLQPTFVEIIDEHPDRGVRALALFCFAQYSGHNERRKTCEAALGYLQRQYGDLPYHGATFAKAADESLYFFRNLAIGCMAPPTVGEDADGAVFRLTDYRGKVIMLRFWGDWCPACRRMYPFERKLVAKYRNQPFALIGVNSDSREVCKRAQRESNLMWRSVWDGGTTHGAMSTIYRIGQWPTIIVIDAKGRIRFRSEGLDETKLNSMIVRLVAEASAADVDVLKSEPNSAPSFVTPTETNQ
jgi:thiol-disulfide isomerase/thioredoxin